MELKTLLQDIHRLNHQLEFLERKYGIMSTTFYEAYSAGEEPDNDAWVLDFEKWAGLYEVWCDKVKAYQDLLEKKRNARASLFEMIEPVPG